MTSPATTKMEQAGDVRVIRFTAGKARDADDVIAGELEGRTDGLAGCHLKLDFSNVTYVNSAELGTLVGLHTRLARAGGRLTLFNLSAQVYEVFTLTRLHTILNISREGPQAAAT